MEELNPLNNSKLAAFGTTPFRCNKRKERMRMKVVLHPRATAGYVLACILATAWAAVFCPTTYGQEASVTEKDLAAFVKVYVEIQKIRSEYEPALKETQEPQQRQKIQQEGEAKLNAALAKQGMEAENYNRIFGAVSADEELRKKTLKLIEQER
jgi:hypothetical protein